MSNNLATLKGQYFGMSDLQALKPSMDLHRIEVIGQDSYSDTEVWKSIENTKAVVTMAVCAIQTAIIGSGSRTYGSCEYKNEHYDVAEIYQMKQVNTKSKFGDKLEPGELTPRRLQRAFRHVIHEFLTVRTDVSSYLWRKYTDRREEYRATCFPGAEHYIQSEDEAEYLLFAYKELDERLKLSISDRILRVLQARGLLKKFHF